jgi:Domain of unknown function (DUF4124)
MRRLIVLIGLTALATSAGAATLNKCIDAQGKVTYSNLPCRNAREVRMVEIDPAPHPVPLRSVQPVKPATAQPAPRSNEPPATIQLETRSTSGKPAARASSRRCDSIADKLGRVLDKMDQARRKGYTPEQMNTWDQEVKDLERKKQQSGCF